jgi:hypothetical protein
MLNFSDLSLRRGKRLLFSGASFNLFGARKSVSPARTAVANQACWRWYAAN